MQSIQLFIEGQRVDMFKDENVSITQSIQNVKDIAKVFTEFTKTFTLPASKANNKIFKHYYNIDITNGFDARTKKDATLELNHLPFKKGKIKLEGVDLQNRSPKSYRITFFGNTVTLKDLLGDDKLNQLTALNTYSENFGATDIERGLKRNSSTYQTGTVDSISSSSIIDSSGFGTVSAGDLVVNTTTNQTTFVVNFPTSNTVVLNEQIFTGGQTYEISNHVLVPLITHTKRLTYDSGVNIQGDGNLFYQAGTDVTYHHGVAWNELKYAIRLQKIIEAIQTEYGITFSTDFFTQTNTAFFNLYMWLHRKKGVVTSGGQVASFTKVIDGWSTATGDTADMINSSTIKITNDNFIDDFRLTLTRSDTTPFDLTLFKNGSSIHTITNQTGTSISLDIDSITTVNDDDEFYAVLTYQSGTTFSQIEWSIDFTTPSGSDVDRFQTGTFTTTAVFEFAITEQIPEIKVIDFLTGIFKMFNLTTFVEDSGTIYVDTLDNFYTNKKSTSTAYDISEFVDVDSTQVNVALPYKEVSFGFEDTDSFFAASFNQLQNREWGKAEATNIISLLTGANETIEGSEYNVVAPFSHFQFERLINLNDDSQTDIQWGWSADDNQESYIGKPLLFYPVHENPTQSISFIDNVSSTGSYDDHKEITVAISMPSNSVAFASGTSTANINFNNELNEYTLDASFTGTLFENYYKTYITNIFKNSNRLTKVKAYLPLRILLNLTLADRFDINGKRYKINSIDTNLATGESNIELLNEL